MTLPLNPPPARDECPGGSPLTLPQLLGLLDAANSPLPAETLAGWLERFSPAPDELAPFVHFDVSSYRRNLVKGDRDYEVLVLCWRQGQASPVHDHRGSACGVFVCSGTATETRYEVTTEGQARPELAVALHAGDVTASFDRDAHRIAAESGDLVTLHVYSPPLRDWTIYPIVTG